MKGNFNHERTIKLRGSDDTFIQFVSQIEAGRLLRADAADLLLVEPPSIKLKVSVEEAVRHLRWRNRPSQSKRRKYLAARRTILYGNYHVTSPDGELLFKCGPEKALWYLNRGLAEVACPDTPTLRFKFEPAGKGHTGDEYYLAVKTNKCVVCGTTQGLNRHHVLPVFYRRNMSSVVKNHSYHDVLLMCLECHENYEQVAEQLKEQIATDYNCPLNGLWDETGTKFVPNKVRLDAISAASALVNYGDKIPDHRKEVLLGKIAVWLNKIPTEDSIRAVAAEAGKRIRNPEGYFSHGAAVVRQLNTPEKVQEFTVRWRKHFLEHMKPQHLPLNWDVNRIAFREDVEPTASGPV